MGIDTNQYANQLLAENEKLKRELAKWLEESRKTAIQHAVMKTRAEAAEAELARRDDAVPATKDGVFYPGDAVGVFNIGNDTCPDYLVAWTVKGQNLPKGVYWVYINQQSAAPAAVLPPEMIPERAHEIGLLEGVDLSYMRRCIASDSYNQAIADAKALGCKPEKVVNVPPLEKWRKVDEVRAQGAYRTLLLRSLDADGVKWVEGDE